MLTAVVLSALLVPTFTTQAWVGGPWSEGDYSENGSTGTYQAVLTGTNLSGVTIFGADANTEGAGRYVVFHNGIAHSGVTFPMVDLSGRMVAGAMDGGAVSTGIISYSSPESSGAFIADITDTKPVLRFSGEGQMYTSTLAANEIATTSTDTNTNNNTTTVNQNETITGSETVGNLTQTITDTTTVNTTVTDNSTETETENTSQSEREMVDFKISGLRTSQESPSFLSLGSN